jgi:broad specificity phosphatase PhoE
MRYLEIRRHSLRKAGGGSQLSQAGIDLARRLGAGMGPFARVATSVVPRSRETAIAMGFAVDFELAPLISDDVMAPEFEATRWWEAAQPFAALAAVLGAGGDAHRFATAVAALWRDVVLSIPEGEAALVVGHSGQLEAALVACLPRADHGAWGAPFACCEGARLAFAGDPPRFTGCDILRVAAP